MTKEEFDLLCIKVKQVDKALGNVINILKAVDRDGLSSSTQTSNSVEDKKEKAKRTLSIDPRLKELIENAEERKKAQQELINSEHEVSVESITRTAPYTVQVKGIIDNEKLLIHDEKNNLYNVIVLDPDEIAEIETLYADNNFEGLSLQLTETELADMEDYWYTDSATPAETE